MSSVIWMSDPLQGALSARLASDRVAPESRAQPVSSLKEYLDATRDPSTVSFLDRTALAEFSTLSAAPVVGPIIAICDEPLQTAVAWLQPCPWLSHVMSASMLEHPIVEEHLANVLRTLTSTRSPRLLDWFAEDVTGRRIRLTQANKRVARIERMSQFFEDNGVGARSLQLLRDAAEELLTNAFYDAPVAAKAMKRPISRAQDVTLPDDNACDLAYGCREDLAIVRVRDPFGSLTRQRLVEVLTRCSRTDMAVEVDESMGGAGLGMWRIFSGASFIGISVLKDRHTEVLVGVAKRATSGARPFAFHFYFRDSTKRRFWQLRDDDSSVPSINKSVMILAKAK